MGYSKSLRLEQTQIIQEMPLITHEAENVGAAAWLKQLWHLPRTLVSKVTSCRGSREACKTHQPIEAPSLLATARAPSFMHGSNSKRHE